MSEQPPVETITGLRVLGDLLDQHPVVDVRAGELEDLDTKFAAEVDGGLVERRRHGDAAGLADGVDQRRVVLVGQPGVERLLDVADVVAVAEVLVDEVVHVTELQLDGGAHVVEAHDPRVVRDDLEAALDAAPVVVRQLQDEQIFEDVAIHLRLQGQFARPVPADRPTVCVGTIVPELK